MIETTTSIRDLLITQIDDLSSAVDNTRTHNPMKARLAIESSCAISYSKFNQFWLTVQAGQKVYLVAGNNTWTKQMEMKIKKGQRPLKIFIPDSYQPVHSIIKPILTPIELYRADHNPETKTAHGSIGYVYADHQVDHFVFPEKPVYLASEKYPAVEAALIQFCERRGMKINRNSKVLTGADKGASLPDYTLVVGEDSATQLIVHELAHNILGHHIRNNQMTRKYRETEAETVNYLISRHFGWDTIPSVNYLVTWRTTGKDIKDCLKSPYVLQATMEILQNLE